MKKLPSKEEIAEWDMFYESDEYYGDAEKIVEDYFPEWVNEFEKWNCTIEIPRRGELSLFTDFFLWLEICQTPLMKALNESSEDS